MLTGVTGVTVYGGHWLHPQCKKRRSEAMRFDRNPLPRKIVQSLPTVLTACQAQCRLLGANMIHLKAPRSTASGPYAPFFRQSHILLKITCHTCHRTQKHKTYKYHGLLHSHCHVLPQPSSISSLQRAPESCKCLGAERMESRRAELSTLDSPV